MKDWEQFEELVAKASGGKRTPGSGNGRMKGDVRLYGKDYIIECKQTSKDFIHLQAAWFHELEAFAKTTTWVVLALGFGLHGVVYWHTGDRPLFEVKDWSSKLVRLDNLPEIIELPASYWQLDYLTGLRILKQ